MAERRWATALDGWSPPAWWLALGWTSAGCPAQRTHRAERRGSGRQVSRDRWSRSCSWWASSVVRNDLLDRLGVGRRFGASGLCGGWSEASSSCIYLPRLSIRAPSPRLDGHRALRVGVRDVGVSLEHGGI